MKKNDDPYAGLSKMLHGIGKRTGIQPGIGVGVIVSPPPSIQVAYNGMILDAADLYVDDYWIPGHQRHMVGETSYRAGGSGMPAYESHNHPIDNDERFTDTWQAGDKVALLPIYSALDMQSAQQYIVLAKLRRLDGE